MDLARFLPWPPLSLALAASLAGCGGGEAEPEGPRGPCVLIVTLDTTRRDYMGFHDRRPSPTPTLDALAAESVLFEDAYTTTPLTLPAHSSLLTGLYPHRHSVRDNSIQCLPQAAETLAERLATLGLRTEAAVSAYVLDPDFGIAQGFDRYQAPAREPATSTKTKSAYMAELPARVTVDRALAVVKETDEPFFLWVHLFDPHFPYAPPNPPSPLPVDGDEAKRALYEAEIRYADSQLARLFGALKDRGLWDDLILVFAADHGECVADGKESTHGRFIYDQTMRIPMLLKAPGLDARRVRGPVSLVDVVPTVMSLLGQPLDEGSVDGRDLAPALAAGVAPTETERLVDIESHNVYLSHGMAPYEGVVNGRYKYVHSRRPELFDRADDPAEEHDLSSERREVVERLAARVEERFVDAQALAQEERALSQADRDRLANLGYLQGDPRTRSGRPDFSKLEDALEQRELLDLRDESTSAMMEGRFDDGAKLLRRVVKKWPGSVIALDRLGMNLLQLASDPALDQTSRLALRAEAKGHLDDAVRLQDGLIKCHYNLGLIAKLTATDLDREAAQLLDAGATSAAEDRAQAAIKQWEAALIQFRITVGIESRYPEGLANVAIVSRTIGKKLSADPGLALPFYEEAERALRDYLSAVPRTHDHWSQFEVRHQLLRREIDELRKR